MDKFTTGLSRLCPMFHEGDTSFETLQQRTLAVLVEATEPTIDRPALTTAIEQLEEVERLLKRETRNLDALHAGKQGDGFVEERTRRMRFATMAALLTLRYGDGGLHDGKKVAGSKKLQVAAATDDPALKGRWEDFRRTLPVRRGAHRLLWETGLLLGQFDAQPPSYRRLISGLLEMVPDELDDAECDHTDSVIDTYGREVARDQFAADSALLYVLCRTAKENGGAGWTAVESWFAQHRDA